MRRATACIALLITNAAVADTGKLIVNVRDLATQDGRLRFALFDSEDHFLHTALRFGEVAVADYGATWIVDGLPFGTYAVTVHHDVNGNGKMERHWYGKPKEPTGASNNPAMRFGPPTFAESRFDFDEPTLTLNIIVD